VAISQPISTEPLSAIAIAGLRWCIMEVLVEQTGGCKMTRWRA